MTITHLLSPWPEARIVCDDERFLVVNKLPGIPVHGGDEVAGDDLVGRLRARDASSRCVRIAGGSPGIRGFGGSGRCMVCHNGQRHGERPHGRLESAHGAYLISA